MRSITVTKANGQSFIVEGIPDDAKITYATINPASAGNMGQTVALRIYRGSKAESGNQIAVFRDVLEFIDNSLTVTEPPKTPKVDWVDDGYGISKIGRIV